MRKKKTENEIGKDKTYNIDPRHDISLLSLLYGSFDLSNCFLIDFWLYFQFDIAN